MAGTERDLQLYCQRVRVQLPFYVWPAMGFTILFKGKELGESAQ